MSANYSTNKFVIFMFRYFLVLFWLQDNLLLFFMPQTWYKEQGEKKTLKPVLLIHMAMLFLNTLNWQNYPQKDLFITTS
jgi:hypothetical protein